MELVKAHHGPWWLWWVLLLIGGVVMVERKGQAPYDEAVEEVLQKLLGTEKLEEREMQLLEDELFRKRLSQRLWQWAHEMKWFI
jgi:hypothetical protein